MKRKLWIVGSLVLIIITCALIYLFFFKNIFSQKSKPLARVNDQYLLLSDIKSLINLGTAPSDSAEMVNRFVENWLKKQTLIEKASQEKKYNDEEIEKKILDYKNTLIVYDYEERYIKSKLDTVISENELNEYYKNNFNSFKLRKDIVKAWIIKLPGNSPKLNETKNLVSLGKDKKKVDSYCSQFALNYSLEDSTWKDFDELIKGTPFQEEQNKFQNLQLNKYSDAIQENVIYLLRVFDFKTSGQISPLSFIKPQVKDVLINNRKVALIQKLEKEIFEQAKKENKTEVYVK